MEVSYSSASKLVEEYLRVGITPNIIGSPGIGKSDIVKQVAKKYNLKVIDVRLAQCDPTDLNGFPKEVNGKASYIPMDTFPIQGDKPPEGYKGWLIFLDEITSAPRAVQAASYKLILDRMIGNHHLHPDAFIVAAGNKITDGAIVEEMSTALQSRMAHFELVINNEEWLEWAYANNIDHRITSYIKFKPENIYSFKPDHTDHTYACPRTWEMCNRLVNGKDLTDTKLYLPLLSGTISEGVAREFIVHTQIYKDLPKQSDIENIPDVVAVPDEPATLYALTGMISSFINKQTADKVWQYVERLPMEFQVVTVRELNVRNPTLFSCKAIQQWMLKNGKVLFG